MPVTRSQTRRRQTPANTQEIPTWGATGTRTGNIPKWKVKKQRTGGVPASSSDENTPPASPVRTASVPATVIATPPRHGTASTALGSPVPVNPMGGFGSPVAPIAPRW